jgi:hypothetical protein
MFSAIKLRKHSADKLDLCNLLITKFIQILHILFVYQVNDFDAKNFNTNVNLINTKNVNIANEQESFEVDLPKPHLLILENTDIGSFQEKTLTDHLKTMITFSPSCRPTGPFLRDPLQNNRTFSTVYYQRQTKQGFIKRA